MPTTLGKPFDVEWRGKPPHLLEIDTPVWYRFLKNHRPETINLHYDVYLGMHDMAREQLKDSMQRMWYYANAKRVDAVIETPTEIWLIEVSNILAIRAIGQALSYSVLYSQDPVIKKIERPVLVGEYMDLDLLGVAGKYGITVFLV
jgi:hypothetical protein